MKKLRVDVWSDIACPWCWIGKRRLDAALARFSSRGTCEVIWRSFELAPSASTRSGLRARPPREPGASYAHWLADRYECGVPEAEARLARITQIAAAEGLELRFDHVRPTSTFDAHRVLQLALDRGVQIATIERLLCAYFKDGELVSDHDTLLRVAASVGLNPEEVRTTLAGDIYDDEVREDEAEAAELGIRGVPFFVFGGRHTISGAQPVEVLLDAMSQAYERIEDLPPASGATEASGPYARELPGRR